VIQLFETCIFVSSPKPLRLRRDRLSPYIFTGALAAAAVFTLSLDSAAATAAEVRLPDNEQEDRFHPLGWYGESLRRLDALRSLGVGWDGAHAHPPPERTLERAREVIGWCQVPGVYEPAIVPTALGGVQIEWHPGSQTLEVYVQPSGDVAAFFENTGTDLTSEGPVDREGLVTLLGAFVSGLEERA
jgi:hypothetical protein